jgi:16S rRNA (guanine966-N2)-methyltransferase
MRIIAGRYKNRVIPTLKNCDYRPSTTKLREALFSILSSGDFLESKPVEDAVVLDLFAGAGTLSFEALSRGAKNITLIDTNKKYLEQATEFAKKIKEHENVITLIMDATDLRSSQQQYTLVFMDPPYHKNYVNKSLISLVKNNWLKTGAIIAIEISKYDDINFIQQFTLVMEKKYGKNKLLLLRYE